MRGITAGLTIFPVVKLVIYDKWELLATAQALLVYLLVRLAEGETKHNNFDELLLGTFAVCCFIDPPLFD